MKTVCAIALLAILMVSPVLAQGPFTDVPTDHWAYAAVDQLTKDGIIVGYPDGTFGGKRAMTRFEFAQALARAIPVIAAQVQTPPAAQTGVSKSDFDALAGRVSALEAKKPEVTKADLDALTKTVNEFKDELTAMGVDLDALKRDVAGLDARLTALEKEVRRIKITGDVSAFAIANKARNGATVDRDERDLKVDGTPGSDKLLQDLTFVKEATVNIDANISDMAKAHVSLVAGSYLNYLDFVDDYEGGSRPVSDSDFSNPTGMGSDNVFPYFANIDAALGIGKLTVGRYAQSWSPYTLKKIDVDSYTVNSKTDSGDYPLDGIRAALKFGGVGVDLFAAKTDTNAYLLNGLTAQPTAGLYNDFSGVGAPFNDVGGHAFGGLTSIEQVAGVRVNFGISKININGEYMEAASSDTLGFDSARLFGGDVNFELGKIMLAAEYQKTEALATGGGADVADENSALDASAGIGFGALGLKGGWKSIGHNFAAPGFWDKLGRWTNPTNIEGPYVDLKYGLGANLSLVAAGEWLSGRDNVAGLPAEIDSTSDNVNYYTAGLKWGMSGSTSVDLGLEWVKWDPSAATNTDEKYITIGLGHSFNPNMMAKIGYQIVDFDTSTDGHSYDVADYKGDLAVAQFMVKF